TNARGRTAFSRAIEYPEHRCCPSARSVADRAWAFLATREPHCSQYGVVERCSATEIRNGNRDVINHLESRESFLDAQRGASGAAMSGDNVAIKEKWGQEKCGT